MKLSRLVYVSDAVRPLSELEIQQLVARAQAKNEAHAITGLLLAGGGQFVQVLEGGLEAVTQVFDVIRADPRHRNVHRLLFEFAPERLFPSWWMGLVHVDRAPAVDRHRLAETVRLGRAGPGSGHQSREPIVAMLREFKSQLLIRSAPAAPLHAAG